jgi:methionine-gamma-lyase
MRRDEYGSASPAIYQTSTFAFETAAEGTARFLGQTEGFVYTRIGNPTTRALEEVVASLEGGYNSLSCATGMGAVSTLFFALLNAGDHVVCSASCYGATHGILEKVFPKYGVETSFVDTSDMEEVRKAYKPNTRFVYVESPANPTLAVCDIEECAKFAHEKNILLIVDNTFMSPILQTPFKLGADIIIHSVTKFINGHSDVVGGMIVTKTEELYKLIRPVYTTMGATMDPHQAWMVSRGIKTLKMRVLTAQENAMPIAKLLESHEAVSRVWFPGLESHPQYAIHQKQSSGPGSLISFEMKGGYKAGVVLMENLKLSTLAVSLGGVETLIQHPAGMTHSGIARDDRIAAGITDGLIRMSVGCEDINDLMADMKQALAKVAAIAPEH